MKFEIKSRWSGNVLFAVETTSWRLAVEAAVKGDAVLTGADLTGADLTGADLTGADLTDAVLTDADLTGAVLTGAVLTGAVLTGADLTDAVLTPIRDDLWAVLSSAPQEVAALRLALVEGRVDGSTYRGACACLVGTIANARGCAHTDVAGLAPDASRPAERFFLMIPRGATPETNQASALAVEWIDDWTARMREAFGPVAPLPAEEVAS